MKKKQIMLTWVLVKVMFVIKIIINVIFVSKEGAHFSFFNLLESVFDVFALLSNMGIIKHIEEELPDGRIVYEISVPILQIGIVRVIEFFYVSLIHTINLKSFLILAGTDVLYLLLLLIDKSSYYYESVEEVSDEGSRENRIS